VDQEKAKKLKNKMLEYLYRDNDGVPSRYADMIEIGMELKCDEETAKMLAMSLHAEGYIQLIDPWSSDAYMTERGLKYLQSLFIGTSREMKTFEPRTPGLVHLRNPQTPDRPRKAIPGKVILVVDDDARVVESMRNLLQDMGYVVDTAMDGNAGLTKAIMIHPALIFLDVNMPAMEGTSVYDRLRQDVLAAEVPVVFLTGTTTEEVQSRITPGPHTYYLQKPVSIELFRETIRKVFPA
jgi:CheY-like chemotaxis protein